MHEASIAEELVRQVRAELDRIEGAVRLKSVRVYTGVLEQIVPDNLAMAFEAMTKDSALENTRLEIIEVQAKLKCVKCGAESEVKIPFFVCPECSSTDVEVIQGKGVWLENLEVEVDE